MFRKSSKSVQLHIFTPPAYLFSGNSIEIYEDELTYHKQIRQQVIQSIDEGIFRPLC